MRIEIFVIIFTLLIVESAYSSCKNNLSNSQAVSEALYQFGTTNNISQQSIYDLQGKIISNCNERQNVFRKIFNILPEKFRQQLQKEKNIKKLKEQIVAAIERAEVQIDGKKFKVMLTDNGNLAMIGSDEGNYFLDQMGDSVSNFLKKETDKVIFSGFIGKRNAALAKTSHKFEWHINGKELNNFQFNKRFAEKALGYIKVSGFKVSKKQVNTSVEMKANWLEKEVYIKMNVVKCGRAFCFNGGGKVDYDFDGTMVVSSSLGVCTGNSSSEICFSSFKNADELGLRGSIESAYEGGKKLSLGVSTSNKAEQVNLKFTSGSRLAAYGQVSKYNIDDKNKGSVRTSEVGAVFDIKTNSDITFGSVRTKDAVNTFVRYRVTF